MNRIISLIILLSLAVSGGFSQTSQMPLDLSDGFNFDTICGPGEYQQCRYDGTQDIIELYGNMDVGNGTYILSPGNMPVINNSDILALSYSIDTPLYLSNTDGLPADGLLVSDVSYHLPGLFGNPTLPGDMTQAANPANFTLMPNMIATCSPHNKNTWQIASVTAALPQAEQDYYDSINFIINGFNSNGCRNMQIVAIYADTSEDILYSFPTDSDCGPRMDDPTSGSADFTPVYTAAYLYNIASGATGNIRNDNTGCTFFEFTNPLTLDNTKVLVALRFEDVNPSLNWTPRGMAIWAATACKTDILANTAPYADAGTDQNITDSDEDGSETVYLNALASTDTDGKIISVSWSENSSTIAVGLTPALTLSLGFHNITLTVTDDNGAISTDTVAINIEAPSENHPIANAGDDQTLLDENASGDEQVTLDGSASYDPNGTIVSYNWSEAGNTIASGVNPTITLETGIHDIRLTVTDNDDLIRYDSITVRIIDWRAAQTYHVAKDGNDSNDGSEENPFLTISRAVEPVEFGDSIIVHEGIYRESIRLTSSGLPGYPITLQAAENEMVTISGAEEVSGWTQCTSAVQAGGNPNYANIWTATINWEPQSLYQDNAPLQIARTPGWMHPADGGTTTTIYDPVNLGQATNYWAGARAVVWISQGTAHYHVNVHSSTTDTLTIDEITYDRTPDSEDFYYLTNKVQLIDSSGQWAIEDNGDGTYTLYVWPANSADPSTALIEASTNNNGIQVDWSNSSYWVIDGFEIRHGDNHGIGGFGPASHHNTICNMCIHHMGGNGIYGRYNESGHYHHNYIGQCVNGVGLNGDNVLFEYNEVAYNRADGLLSGGDNITIRDNLVHHHIGEGHCDNLQSYDSTPGGRVEQLHIERNMVYAGGQTYMMETVYDPTFDSNVFLGATAYMLIFGHNSCDNATITSNTLMFSGFGLMNTSGCLKYALEDNIFFLGRAGNCFGMPLLAEFTSDYNLFYTADNEADNCINYITTGATLAQWQTETGQDANSIYGSPQFVNVPVHINLVDVPRVTECTPTKVYMQNLDSLEVGDHIEFDYDGVIRTVTAIGADFIEFTPAEPKAIEKLSMVCNWKDNTDFTYDLSLAVTSPAIGAASDSGNIGSPINTVDYMQADFNGDSQCDITRWPGLIAASAPELKPGDADADGDVDMFDFMILRSNYGSLTGAKWSDGDFDADGDVDIFDFLILRSNYGS